MVGTLWGLLVPSMLVYKIWCTNRDKQPWEGWGEHEKGKKQRLAKVSQLFLSETVAFETSYSVLRIQIIILKAYCVKVILFF